MTVGIALPIIWSNMHVSEYPHGQLVAVIVDV